MQHYDSKLKPKARILRSHMTDAEQRLWERVRRKQILGVQFYRQKPIGGFIVDFYAPSASLVIELDGGQHCEPDQQQYDQRRSLFLEQQGLTVLRFTNLDVLKNLEGVVEIIFRVVQGRLGCFENPPCPPFSKGVEECLTTLSKKGEEHGASASKTEGKQDE